MRRGLEVMKRYGDIAPSLSNLSHVSCHIWFKKKQNIHEQQKSFLNQSESSISPFFISNYSYRSMFIKCNSHLQRVNRGCENLGPPVVTEIDASVILTKFQ